MKMKKQIINTFYHIGIEIDFENIYSYCKFTEDALAKEKDNYLAIYKRKEKKLTPKEKEMFKQFAIEMHWKLYDVFPAFQWSSIFNSAYAMFEKHLNDLCKIFEKETSTGVGLKDLKGKGIERAKIFLSKVIGVKNVFDSTEWKEIRNYSKARNILVHASGKLDLTQKNHQEVFRYAKNQPKLFVFHEDPDSDSAQITILPELIYKALMSYKILLVKICKYNSQLNKG